MKIVNLKLHESNTQSVYVDFDKIFIMDIKEVGEVKTTDHGLMVIPLYQVNATFDNGTSLILFKDSKKDICNNWITQNWVKR
jgi:hypothetical protein